MPKRLTLKDAQIAADKRGGKCLSRIYKNKDTKMQWECGKGHQWWAILHHIRHGRAWCPVCSHHVRLTMLDVTRRAEKAGITCLSTSITPGEKLLWECQKGHSWWGFIASELGGCPTCAGKRQTIEEMMALAQGYGGKCLSEMFVPNAELLWECAKGHIFTKLPTSLKCGYWCPRCAGRGITVDDMASLAKSRGGEFLSPKYSGTDTKHEWRCAKGHTWFATPNNVKRLDSWCPECKANKRERKCRDIFESILGVTFPKTRPTWLKNSRGNQMELDGYSEGLGLAFEYQGFQHYEKAYDRSEKDFEWQQQRDREKLGLCLRNDVTVIVIPWTTPDLRGFVQSQLDLVMQ